MLDDLKFIHQRDAQDALGLAEKQWQQLVHDFQLPALSFQPTDIDNIVYGGMGGSALAALLSKTWPGYDRPFEIVRQFNLPKYVGRRTLFIGSSYSGNTAEELSMLAEAEKAAAKIVVITGGGKLAEIAKQKGYPTLILPDLKQPRFAALANFKAIITILGALGIINKETADKELSAASEFLKNSIADWLPTVPQAKNPAKQLALELVGKSIAVYGGPLTAPAAYKWKISFNENAKNVAWWNELPEFDHNELIGWSSHPHDKPYGVVNLLSSREDPAILKRFKVANKLLSGRRPMANNVEAQGSNLLEQLLWLVAFGDFVSLYLALLNNVNPTPVDLIERFKNESES